MCLYLMSRLLQGCVCAAPGQQPVVVQSRAEMSGLAFGAEPYLGTSSCWRQPSLAPIIPQVLHSLSPSGGMCMMADVFEFLFRCNLCVFVL